MNCRGISSVISAALLVTLFSLVYVSFLTYGVPGYCKEAESRMIDNFIEDMINLAAEGKNVIATGRAAGAKVSDRYSYPTIPLFITPRAAMVSSTTYDITVTISNIKSPEIAIPNSITLKGKGVLSTLNLVYTSPVSIYIEAGIVAGEKIHLDGFILSGSEIQIPLFSGGALSRQLSPLSAGGSGILIQNNAAGNITVQIIGTKIPRDAWVSFSRNTGLRVDYSSNSVTIHIPPGTYVFRAGLASFITGSTPLPPAYLYSRTPLAQTSPGTISVNVLDEFFNPTIGAVNLSCAQPCTIQYIQNNQLVTVQNSATLPPGRTASATVTINPGVVTVISSVNRPVGGPYQLAYLISR
ncbi:MAG: hypothetical protein QXU01_02780 [Candidatus Hadarchaeales archaeon]